MHIGDRIREIRKSKNMTLRDLAEKVGVSFVYVSQIERGERTLSTNKLREWGEALEVDLLKEASEKDIEEIVLNQFKPYEEIKITRQGIISNILTLLDKDTDILTDTEIMELWFKVEALVKFELYKMNK